MEIVDPLHMLSKAVGVEGGPDMGIADLHQAHLLGELGRCEGIGGGPHMVVGHPAAGQPQNAQDQGRRPRPIALRLPFADFCDEEGDQVTDHPEGHQMEEADHCVHQVQGGPQEDGRRREEPKAQEPRQPLFAMGQPQHRRKAGRPEGDIEEPRGEYSQHGPDDHKPNRHSFPSITFPCPWVLCLSVFQSGADPLALGHPDLPAPRGSFS